VQAHQMVLAVGRFAAVRMPTSAAHADAFAAAAAAQRIDRKKQACAGRGEDDSVNGRRGNGGGGGGSEEEEEEENDAAAAATAAHISTHALFAPHAYTADDQLRLASGATVAALASFEEYLGRPFPYPGGLAFAFVPPDAMPTAGSGDQLPALLGAGVNIVSTDRLAHPLSACDTVDSRVALAECAARQLFGGTLNPKP